MKRGRCVSGYAAVVMGVAVSAPAWALGDADRGRDTAERWCSTCHVVSDTQQEAATDGAPPFMDIATQPDLTPALVGVFLQTPHMPMPDFELSNADIDDLVAYFETLGLD